MSEDTKPAGGEHPISEYYEGVKQLEMQGHESGVRKARNALYVTAALLFISELITAAISDIPVTVELVAIAVVEAGIFVGLALWTKTRPYAAILAGLALFIGLWILAIAIAGLQGAVGGIIVRIIIISYLVSAIKPAKAWEALKKNP
ncbi:MAG TPA: hypothetical protein VEB63_08810 [Chitinophagaceae bacterium]|nr:hypothetical protein [Chitinophagaceae bacterium]